MRGFFSLFRFAFVSWFVLQLASTAIADDGERVAAAMLELPLQSLSVRRAKVIDHASGELVVVNEQVDAEGRTKRINQEQLHDLRVRENRLQRKLHGPLGPVFEKELKEIAERSPEERVPFMLRYPFDPAAVPERIPAEKLADLTDEQADQLTRKRFASFKAVLARAGKVALQELHDVSATGVRQSRIGPFVHAELDAKTLLAFAHGSREAVRIYEARAPIQPELDTSVCTVGADVVASRGIVAGDLEVGIMESEQVPEDYSDQCLDVDAVLDDQWDTVWTDNLHPVAVAGIAASKSMPGGVAPGANIVSLDIGVTDNVASIDDGLSFGMSNGVEVYNLSFGTEDSAEIQGEDILLDYFVRHHDRLVVKSSGNVGGTTDGPVTSPGLAYNVLTVGNFNDRGSCGRTDDQMSTTSAFGNPDSPNGDRQKPEMVAPGTSIQTLKYVDDVGNVFVCPTRTTGGTSLSAPHVTGAAALLIRRRLELRSRPDTLRAILMASAVNNIVGSARLSNQDGVGGLRVDVADDIIANNNYRQWKLWPSDFDSSNNFQAVQLHVHDSAQRLKMNLSWLSDPEHPDLPSEDEIGTDYDLMVFFQAYGDPNRSVIASSTSFDNNFETIDLDSPEPGIYTAYVRILDTHTNALEPVSLAWTLMDPCQSAGGDIDGDGICGDVDNCPGVVNGLQQDNDGDGIGNHCDNCVDAANPGQEDLDHDGEGDACDKDIDGDGCENDIDLDPLNPIQRIGKWHSVTCVPSSGIQYGSAGMNSDGVGVLDCATDDNDGDGIPDDQDECPISGPNAPNPCIYYVDCPVQRWWDVCLFGGCNEVLTRIDSIINPNPVEQFETIEIVNQTLYIYPDTTTTLRDIASAFRPGAVPQRSSASMGSAAASRDGRGVVRESPDYRLLSLWTTVSGEPRQAALITKFLPNETVVGKLEGKALAVTVRYRPESDLGQLYIEGTAVIGGIPGGRGECRNAGDTR